jgi:dinuclear metal center YbgI/SA1388 family protein
MVRNELVAYLNNLLEIDKFKDYCPNGLQIEGRQQINKIAFAVTASQFVIEQALAQGCDTLITHHGYFWKNENQAITGIKKQRIEKLIKNDINLISYHLPLDMHAIYGNNTCLARLLNLTELEFFEIGVIGKSSQNLSAVLEIIKTFSKNPLVIENKQELSKIALCTGGGQGYFEKAISLGADLFISGESNEQAYHLANEYGVNFIAAGHHNTETFGVLALKQHLEDKFECLFINENNPC